MIRSMTGFTRESRVFEWGTLTVEISSVNSRYQEISLRLPRELASFETSLNALLRKGLGRGKVRLLGEISWAPRYRAVVIDRNVLGEYHIQLRELAKELGEKNPPELQSLLTLPGVFDSPSVLSLVEREAGKALEEILQTAIGSLKAMRQQEGDHLAGVMKDYLEAFSEGIETLEDYWKFRKETLLEETRARISVLLEGVTGEADPGRIMQEIVLLGDKWDISEEFDRSKSHVLQFRSIMDGKASEGRKLDFLLQEMNREVNTMGSKITDADLRWKVVDLKTLLEKIREQVQNVE